MSKDNIGFNIRLTKASDRYPEGRVYWVYNGSRVSAYFDTQDEAMTYSSYIAMKYKDLFGDGDMLKIPKHTWNSEKKAMYDLLNRCNQ